MTYLQLRDFLISRNLIDEVSGRGRERLSLASLRLAVSDLARELESQDSPLRLSVTRSGREVRIGLIALARRDRTVNNRCRLLYGELPETLEPARIARRLVETGVLGPPAALYMGTRAAARWLSYSAPLSHTKCAYEASVFDRVIRPLYEADELVGLIGLAPGEGLGEIAILESLLRGPRAVRNVHYLAVDSSELLLTSHRRLVRDRFGAEIESGKLLFAPVCGDAFAVATQIEVAREQHGGTFLAVPTPVVTYLGNCLGNSENEEWHFLQKISAELSSYSRPHFLLGVSALRRTSDGNPIEDRYEVDALTLDAARSLVEEGSHLISMRKDGSIIAASDSPEFLVRKRALPVRAERYANAMGVTGVVYRFRYRLRNTLAVPDRSAVMPAGSNVVLSVIIKYEVETLVALLRERGFQVVAPDRHFPALEQVNGLERYRYAVLAVTGGRRG
jgi:hypothetical protein